METKTDKIFYQKWWFWLIIVVVLIGAISGCGSNSDDTDSISADVKDIGAASEPVEQTQEIVVTPTVAPTPTSTPDTEVEDLDSSPVFELSLDEWVENLNIWQAEMDGSLINVSDIEISDGIFTLYLNDYVYYIGKLDSDNNIVSVMVGGVGDGTVESGAVVMSGLIGLIISINPEYTPDQCLDVIEALGLLSEEIETNTTATIDGTKYSFMTGESFGTMIFAFPEN